jgi:hypothetical protein
MFFQDFGAEKQAGVAIFKANIKPKLVKEKRRSVQGSEKWLK